MINRLTSLLGEWRGRERHAELVEGERGHLVLQAVDQLPEADGVRLHVHVDVVLRVPPLRLAGLDVHHVDVVLLAACVRKWASGLVWSIFCYKKIKNKLFLIFSFYKAFL